MMLPFMGCGSTEDGGRKPGVYVSYEEQSLPQNGTVTGACREGTERVCSVILGKYEGVVSCFVGVQRCEDGVWGPCGHADAGTDPIGAGGAGVTSGAAGAGGAAGANDAGAGGGREDGSAGTAGMPSE